MSISLINSSVGIGVHHSFPASFEEARRKCMLRIFWLNQRRRSIHKWAYLGEWKWIWRFGCNSRVKVSEILVLFPFQINAPTASPRVSILKVGIFTSAQKTEMWRHSHFTCHIYMRTFESLLFSFDTHSSPACHHCLECAAAQSEKASCSYFHRDRIWQTVAATSQRASLRCHSLRRNRPYWGKRLT